MRNAFLHLGVVVVMLGIAQVLISCGQVSKVKANLSGYDQICINDVRYYQFPSGVTVAYNKNGSVVSCMK